MIRTIYLQKFVKGVINLLDGEKNGKKIGKKFYIAQKNAVVVSRL
tara:strand:+ start:2637 stop:2771 length:135 start_codon:yes stop_codon:yes gene_type:complete